MQKKICPPGKNPRWAVCNLYDFLVFHLVIHIVDCLDITDKRRVVMIVLREVSVFDFQILLTNLVPPTGDGLNCSCLVKILFGVGSNVPVITVVIRIHTFFVDEAQPVAVVL